MKIKNDTMTDNHPITVPAGSITGWKTLYRETYQGGLSETEYIATQAARWGADQELEACCALLDKFNDGFWCKELRAARRPKPPSLKEQALAVIENSAICDHLSVKHAAILRRALEQLDD